MSELLLKEHKLDKINAENLLNSFGGDLSHINELLQDAKAEANFVESYQGQTEELETLLATNTKQVKDFFDNMCKNGYPVINPEKSRPRRSWTSFHPTTGW